MKAGGGRAGPEPRALVWRVWLATFVYAALAAMLVQFVILPHLLPAWHAGDGLLVGGDWVVFHGYAANRAARIRAEGWSAFELRPYWNAPVGIASAIYALTWPKPWTLIPLNAALHATAAALLFRLLRGVVADWRWALVGVAPFVFYPSALVWISQIHKDGVFIAGYLCLFVAWAELARHDPGTLHWRGLGRALVLLPVGLGAIWLVRPDLTRVAHAGAALALGVLAVRIAAWIWRHPRAWQRAAAVLALACVTTLASAWLTHVPALFSGTAELPDARKEAPGAPDDHVPVREQHLRRGARTIPWYRSAWLPVAVDRVAYQIALTRELFVLNYLESRSTVDAHVGFYRATDVLRYLPRALQVALLAPFPTDWWRTGSLVWTSAGRRVVAAEMLGVYPALLSLLVVAGLWRRRADLWIVVLPCLATLTLYSLAVPNLGALHRFRYGFLMTLVGLGLAGGLALLGRRAAGTARSWRR